MRNPGRHEVKYASPGCDLLPIKVRQAAYGRVANVLMDLAEERGDGTLFIPEKLTQQDIADRVGASREMVARILKDLTIGEYIRFEGRNIVINTRLPAKY